MLYEASSWHEIGAFLFGPASDGAPPLPPASTVRVRTAPHGLQDMLNIGHVVLSKGV